MTRTGILKTPENLLKNSELEDVSAAPLRRNSAQERRRFRRWRDDDILWHALQCFLPINPQNPVTDGRFCSQTHRMLPYLSIFQGPI